MGAEGKEREGKGGGDKNGGGGWKSEREGVKEKSGADGGRIRDVERREWGLGLVEDKGGGEEEGGSGYQPHIHKSAAIAACRRPSGEL